MDAVTLVERIIDQAPSVEWNGVTYYIVERDRKDPESDLLAYAKEVLDAADPATPPPATMERLVVATAYLESPIPTSFLHTLTRKPCTVGREPFLFYQC